MEFYYMATGVQHWLDLHATHMQGQSFYIPAVAPNGQTIQQEMKGMLQPIRLYRYVFPKGAENIVYNTLSREAAIPNGLNIQAWALRKALGLKEIPPYSKTSIKMPVTTENIQIVPIGIKEDAERILHTTGVKQEDI